MSAIQLNKVLKVQRGIIPTVSHVPHEVSFSPPCFSSASSVQWWHMSLFYGLPNSKNLSNEYMGTSHTVLHIPPGFELCGISGRFLFMVLSRSSRFNNHTWINGTEGKCISIYPGCSSIRMERCVWAHRGWDHSSKAPNLQAWNTSSSSMCRSRGGQSSFCWCLSLGSLHAAAAAHPRLQPKAKGPIMPVFRLYFSASFMLLIMTQAAFYFCVES